MTSRKANEIKSRFISLPSSQVTITNYNAKDSILTASLSSSESVQAKVVDTGPRRTVPGAGGAVRTAMGADPLAVFSPLQDRGPLTEPLAARRAK